MELLCQNATMLEAHTSATDSPKLYLKIFPRHKTKKLMDGCFFETGKLGY